uniref:NADH-ubiquinone oxidoreductase chain 2 n=1 Tax=Cyrtodactylus sp. 3 IA-2014 TaxID=1554517 RepID=A0A097DB38_9SAUR|nr:NADH dehydrogenase subunit 2 [Cyrtodactylus sp. 3 IA-2014]
MNPLIWSTLITGLATSTILTMASHHWLLAWLGLELNTLSILPIIMKPMHPRATEATTKYFLIQATAATMILFASTTNAWQTGQWSITSTTTTTALLVTTAIMLKLGLAPVHIWYPQVLQSSTMYTALTISTWQKLAPLALLYMMHSHLDHTMLLLLGLLSSLVGGWGGLNQTQTRMIMAFSSIAHMGWLVTALTLNPSLATLTMLTYMIMTTAMFTPLASTNAKTISDIGTTWPMTPTTLTMTMITLMSLGGLPPLTGFMPKWLILKDLLATNMTTLATLILLSSLPSLFFYIRVAYLTMLTTPPSTTSSEHQWRFQTKQSPNTTILIMATTMLLPLAPTLYNTT